MDPIKQQQLEAKGWKMGSVKEFLELTPEESSYIELKLALGRLSLDWIDDVADAQAAAAVLTALEAADGHPGQAGWLAVVSDDVEDELDWQAMSLAAFEKDWDNPDDAIYDNWRYLFGVPAQPAR